MSRIKKDRIVDLTNPKRRVNSDILPSKNKPRISAIENLSIDSNIEYDNFGNEIQNRSIFRDSNDNINGSRSSSGMPLFFVTSENKDNLRELYRNSRMSDNYVYTQDSRIQPNFSTLNRLRELGATITHTTTYYPASNTTVVKRG